MRWNVILAIITGFFSISSLIFGSLYLLAASVESTVPRLITGAILVVVGLVLILFTYLIASYQPKPREAPSRVTVDLPAETRLQALVCENCNATLDPKSIKMKEGVIMVDCPYCSTIYELTEEPKW